MWYQYHVQIINSKFANHVILLRKCIIHINILCELLKSGLRLTDSLDIETNVGIRGVLCPSEEGLVEVNPEGEVRRSGQGHHDL